MCGGGGGPVDFVTDVFDKADNWTEDVGETLAEIDPGPAIGKIGETFDKEVLQNVDVGTVATVAAIATQQYYLIPYIAAANTAIKGGSPVQIATSFGIAYAGGQFAPGISEAAGGGFGGAVAAGATMGAASGAAKTEAAGGNFEDVLKNAGKGAVVGGVTGGVSQGVSQGYDAFKSELGFGQPTLPSAQADAEFAAAQAESLRTQPGGVSDAQMADTLSREGIDKFAAQDIATLTNQGIGQDAVAQNLAASYAPGEIYKPIQVDTDLEKAGKKLASKVISSALLEEIFPMPEYDPNASYGSTTTYRYKRKAGDTGIDYGNTGDGSDLMGTTNVDLTAVTPSQYDLKKFVNATGDSRLIPFKDNKPETPIPAGYTEAETIGKAEGGLIGNSSTTMVKYSNKPLMGPRKTVKKPKEKKATAGKGLAVRKT
jgi:hypothetical protein